MDARSDNDSKSNRNFAECFNLVHMRPSEGPLPGRMAGLTSEGGGLRLDLDHRWDAVGDCFRRFPFTDLWSPSGSRHQNLYETPMIGPLNAVSNT